jgi:hypothetical protein
MATASKCASACPPAHTDPGDTIKARLQIQGSASSQRLYTGTWQAFRQVGLQEVQHRPQLPWSCAFAKC